MQSINFYRLAGIIFLSVFILTGLKSNAFAQSRPQRPDMPQGDGKKNQRPVPKTEEQLKKEAEEKKQREEEKNAVVDNEVLKIDTSIVNVDAVVLNKKTGQIITGLKKENFSVYENGVKQDISNFSTPEAPITVTLVVEYSKWSEIFGLYASRGQEAGKLEVIRPVAYFLSKFIKAPDDYASIIAFDIRPTPITDFTNDPNRLNQTVIVAEHRAGLLAKRNSDDPGSAANGGDLDFIGGDAFNAPDQARTFTSDGNTFVAINETGNSTAEMYIRLDGLHSLEQTDFIF